MLGKPLVPQAYVQSLGSSGSRDSVQTRVNSVFEFIVFVAPASKNHLLTILGAPFSSCLEANEGGRKTSVSEHTAIAA